MTKTKTVLDQTFIVDQSDKLTKKQQQEADKQSAIAFFKKNVNVGDTLYGVTRHSTRSNSYHYMRFYIIVPEAYERTNNLTRDSKAVYRGFRLWDVTSQVMDAFPHYRYSRKHSGIEIQWDNGQNVADDLSALLFTGPDPWTEEGETDHNGKPKTRVLEHLYYSMLS